MTVRPCPSSRTSISTTVWRWLPWRPGWRGCASIPVTSGHASMWTAWWMPPRPTAPSSGWASIPVPWKSICCRNTAAPVWKPWWRARSAMCACWRTGASTIPRSPSSPLRCSIPSRPIACWPDPAIIRCTSASPRRAGSCAARSSPPWAWASCCMRASATPCASRSRPILPRK